MDLSHDAVVAIAKPFALFYFIGFSIAILVYALWPSNGRKFDRAAKSVLNDEDGPCR